VPAARAGRTRRPPAPASHQRWPTSAARRCLASTSPYHVFACASYNAPASPARRRSSAARPDALCWGAAGAQRDLKPQNLLLAAPGPGAVLKIADFGFARSLQPSALADTLCGSPLYMAPEILRFHKYDAKADLWSVGTILFELVVGARPARPALPYVSESPA